VSAIASALIYEVKLSNSFARRQQLFDVAATLIVPVPISPKM